MNASKTIGLADYGSGNLRSVAKALELAPAQVRMLSGPDQLDDCDALFVPGVGAFGDCVRQLKARALWDPIAQWIRDGRPFFGICLGYQLLFEASEESPGVKGFGVLPGEVRRFPANGLKVPHMGWNTLEVTQADPRTFAGLPAEPAVYFVHSYFPDPEDSSIVSAWASYGGPFAASIRKDNIRATQFHPEKSQEIGLTLLRNFVEELQS